MKVAMFGAGLMGHALALVYALGGHTIRMTDDDPETLASSRDRMQTALATLRDGAEADGSWTDARLDAVVTRCNTVAETLEGAELIVEAITEAPDAKRALYAEIDALAPIDVIIASNTSGLDIFPLVPERRLARTLIAHWYSPPYLVDLCDIVGSPRTDPVVIETVRTIVADIGKVPVVMKKFIPGYIANRVQGAIWLEVTMLLDQGYASARDIDDAIIHGLALRMPISRSLGEGRLHGTDSAVRRDEEWHVSAAGAANAQRSARRVGRGGPHRCPGRRRLLRLERTQPRRAVRRTRPQAAGAQAGIAGDRHDAGRMNQAAVRTGYRRTP